MEELFLNCFDSLVELLFLLFLEFNEIDSDGIENDDKYYLDKDSRILVVGFEYVDLVCVKFDEYIWCGIILKDKIFYCYLKDVVEFFVDLRY